MFDEEQEKIEKYIKSDTTTYKLVADGKNFHQKYCIGQFPTTVLIDTAGVLNKKYTLKEELSFKVKSKNQ